MLRDLALPVDVLPRLDPSDFPPVPRLFNDAPAVVVIGTDLCAEYEAILGILAAIAAKNGRWSPVRISEVLARAMHLPLELTINLADAMWKLIRSGQVEMLHYNNTGWIVPTPEFAEKFTTGVGFHFYRNRSVA